MNEHELLEMAAKAAGIKAQYSDNFGDFSVGDPYSPAEVRWNPLADDGDALRLAVKLNIHLSPYGTETGMTAWGIRDIAESFDEHYGSDPCAAARRAIVRAAADIARLMP